MARYTAHVFQKGINKRVDIERTDDPTRLYTLQNARLFQRGETGYVSRIKGFSELISNNFINVLDIKTFDDKYIIVFRRGLTQPNYNIDIVEFLGSDFSTGVIVDSFGYQAPGVTQFGKLIVQENTVFIAPHNKQLDFIDGAWYLNDTVSTTPTLVANPTILFPETIEGNLQPNEVYWYTARFVYRDGHKTKTAFPKKAKTTNLSRSITVNIQGAPDLKTGEWADIEIFRRRGSGDFFFISRESGHGSIEFVDDGKSNIRPLNEQNYVWNKSHQTHEIVRDRYVRANIEYDGNDYEGGASISVYQPFFQLDSNIGTPINTNLELFARPRFEDGTESYFKLKDTLEIDESGTFSIQQTPYTGDQSIKEIGYYATYSPNPNVNQNSISFSSNELYNTHIPSIESHLEEDVLQDKPISPHIFLGFRYINRRLEITSQTFIGSTSETETTYKVRERIYDDEWADNEGGNAIIYEGDSYTVKTGEQGTNDFDGIQNSAIYPRYIEKEVIPGITLLYKYKYDYASNAIFRDHPNEPVWRSVIYELAWVNGLVEYAAKADLKVSLTNLTGRASTTKSDSEITNEVVDVISVEDTNTGNSPVRFITGNAVLLGNNALVPPSNSRIYLVCTAESILSDININGITDYNVYDDWGVDQFANNELFTKFRNKFDSSILNIDYETDDTTDDFQQRTLSIGGESHQYRERLYDDKVIQTIPDINIEEGNAIYLGAQRNGPFELLPFHTGFLIDESDDFRFWTLDPSNIYATIIEKSDLESLEKKFPNQLIWSQPFLLGTNITGARTFEFTAVLDIARDYGEIVDIRYIANNLIVFCERGVANVNVGEVLTQQASGQTFVDTSRFLTGFSWMLKNIPRIERDSIAEFEDSLFFSDGLDIWVFSGEGLQNVSLGSVDLNEGAKLTAVIDPKNKEYLIYDEQNTWAYNFETQQYHGPYTFPITVGTNLRDNLFTITNLRLVKQNTGNTFNGTLYNTVIESVSNDLGEPSVEKLYRKFFVDADADVPLDSQTTTTFSYGKEYDNFVTRSFPGLWKRSHYYNVGIKQTETNSPRIFWRLTTRAPGFVLKMVSFIYSLRRRR